jgi:intracellular multiplication protein IcmL
VIIEIIRITVSQIEANERETSRNKIVYLLYFTQLQRNTMSSEDVPHSISLLKEQNLKLQSWVAKLAIWAALGPLIVGASVLYVKPSAPKYFRSTPDGRLLEMVPADRPFLNQSQVLSFATDCVYRSFGLDFHKWRNQITDARECFTDDGYESYRRALEKSGNLSRMQTDRLVSTPYSTGPAVVAAEGAKNGVYTWTVQQPIAITWENSGKKLEQKGLAEIVVVRVSTLEKPSAVAIESINIRGGI